MSRADVVILGAVIVVMGCATTSKEEAEPASSPRIFRAERPAVPQRVQTISIDAHAPAAQLGSELAARIAELGVSGPAALVWGDVSPAPPGARRVEIRAGSAAFRGFLVPSAHEVDMGQLAPGIHNVVMVGWDERGLYGSHPSGPGRHRIDVGVSDAESRREPMDLFAFVSVLPGDVSGSLTAGQVVSLFERLPASVRYAVLALPS